MSFDREDRPQGAEGSEERIASIVDALSATMAGDFSVRLPVVDTNGQLDAICAAVNMAVEEIQYRTAEAERLHAELRRRSEQSAELQRVLAATVADGLVVSDEEGTIVSVNPALERMFDYPRDALIGQSITQLMPDSARSHHGGYVKRYLETGRGNIIGTGGMSLLGQRRDGTTFPIRLSVSDLRGGDERMFAALIYDMTLHWEKQGAQNRLAAIAQHATDAIIVVGGDGQVTDWNRAAERLLGYTQSEMLGQSLRRLVPADGVAEADSVEAKLACGEAVDHETLCLHKDGSAIPVSIVAWPMVELSAASGYACIIRDLSERRRSELQMRRLAFTNTHTDDAVMSTGAGGKVMDWNPAAERLYGYSADEIVGRDWMQLVPRDRRAQATGILDRLEAGQPTLRLETQWLTKNGSTLPVSVSFTLLRDEFGKTIGLAALSRDLTNQKRAELALESARDAAESASRAKTQLVANVSHEFRTPLHAIVNMAQLLAHEPLSSQQQSYVDTLGTAADMLKKIVADVLDLSKQQVGTLVLDHGQFSVHSVVQQAVQLASIEWPKSHVALHTDIQPDVPRLCQGDAVRLSQILGNLLTNALKFTDQGSVTARVSRLSGNGDGSLLYFEIADTGCGVPPDEQVLIFEPFEQGRGGSYPGGQGAGLGLAICKQLVTLMGGEIGLTSSGGGATFWFTAWLGGATSESSDLPPVPAAHVPADRGSALKSAPILVADDDALGRTVATAVVESLGYEVHLVEDGRAAVTACARGDWSAVLMDCQMPIMDGIDAAREIRQLEGNKDLPIIAMTAHATMEDRDRCLAVGMTEYLVKPVGRSEIAAVLQRLVAPPPIPAVMDSADEQRGAAIDETRMSELLDMVTPEGAMKLETRMRVYGRDACEQAATIQAALDDGDAVAVARFAHKAISGAAALGATRIVETCREIATSAKADRLLAIGPKLNDLRAEIERTQAAVDNYFQRRHERSANRLRGGGGADGSRDT